MKKIKKLFSAVLFSIAFLLILPVILPTAGEVVNAATAEQRTLIQGRSLEVKITNSNISSVTWTSSNTGKAYISEKSSNGKTAKIYAKAQGSAIITARGITTSGKVATKQYVINVATVNKKTLVRSRGGSYTLKLSGVPSGQSVKWSITDSDGKATSVASLSKATASSVLVTANTKKAGTAYVKVNIGGLRQTCTKVKVEASYISKKELTLEKGKTSTLSIKSTTQKVTWSSSNTSVATVSSSGKVTAKKAGTAKIYGVVGNVRFTCDVTVKSTPTAAEYMKQLKAAINKSTKINDDGNHYLVKTSTNGTTKVWYYVIYERGKDRLKFTFKRKDSATKAYAYISMYIYAPDNSSKAYKMNPSVTVTTPKGVEFKSSITTDYRKYSRKIDIPFNITKSNVSLTSSVKKDMQALSNDYLQTAIKGWGSLLQKKGYSFIKIGFKSINNVN